MGIEPTSSAWEAEVLPLNYTRIAGRSGVYMLSPYQVTIEANRQRESELGIKKWQ